MSETYPSHEERHDRYVVIPTELAHRAERVAHATAKGEGVDYAEAADVSAALARRIPMEMYADVWGEDR